MQPSQQQTLIQKHQRVCQNLNQLYEKKNHDYGNSFGDTFQKLGLISAVTRINDKCQRLISISTKPPQVQDETIKDTLTDLANYAIMTIMELEKLEVK